jgi:hypothetical protein
MIYYPYAEGATPKNGINVYDSKDTHNAGVIIRSGWHLIYLRWSKTFKKFHFQHIHAKPFNGF